ncbi:hypothetical protein QYE76_006803 [Lolium multiflorum]|uniref:Uncharacterized protein n=1 Tax=Lolium multiflorum TaxID=4521 RepID=A0AAD8RVG0_LOLMU|nr:hypothetical protein QYE76_006803 [Lolium multiflorum]
MGKKCWPFRKTKNDQEASSSRSVKKARVGRYVRVYLARQLWEENRPVPWPDANPGGLVPELAARAGPRARAESGGTRCAAAERSCRRICGRIVRAELLQPDFIRDVGVRRAPPRYLADVDYFERKIAAEEERTIEGGGGRRRRRDEDVTMANSVSRSRGEAGDSSGHDAFQRPRSCCSSVGSLATPPAHAAVPPPPPAYELPWPTPELIDLVSDDDQ